MGVENHDPLVATMLADVGKPRAFEALTTPKNAEKMQSAQKKKKKS